MMSLLSSYPLLLAADSGERWPRTRAPARHGMCRPPRDRDTHKQANTREPADQHGYDRRVKVVDRNRRGDGESDNPANERTPAILR